MAASQLLFPAADEPKSILLKRGPVLLQKQGRADKEERELILLSHGFIIATPFDVDDGSMQISNPKSKSRGTSADCSTGNTGTQQQHKLSSPTAYVRKIPSDMVKKSSGVGKKVIRRHFEAAKMLSSSVYVEDTKAEKKSFAVIVSDDGDYGNSHKFRYVFTCAKTPQKQAWIDAFEMALQNSRIHHKADAEAASAEDDKQTLFAGAIQRANERREPHETEMTAVAVNMTALQERRKRLEKLENKTAGLKQNAANYRDNARQLKEKAKKQSMFGF